jgi:tRNA nucleotidyltransferase/poly(A) polymerase
MPTLIACLSSGKGTWTEVNKIILSQQWDKIYLITSNFGQENYNNPSTNTALITTDFFQEIPKIVDQITSQLKNKITDFEVAINLTSGTGKEHMAILEAVLELGLNFRIVTLNNNGQLEVLGLRR